jgi:translocation and assembly module TamA
MWSFAAIAALDQRALASEVAADASSHDAEAKIAYHIVIDAPSALKATLERNLSLVRWQSYDEVTDELLELLKREAIDEARSIAAAEGFFSARIDIDIDHTTTPMTVTVKVEPNDATRVDTVRIEVTGPATDDVPRGTDAIGKLKRDWSLSKGEVFKQSSWAAAKARAAATLAASPYAAAKIAQSEASIDPDKRSADLFVELESGPPFRFGELQISGLQKYNESLVRNYSTIRPGDPYSELELSTFLRRLNGSGYFASAQGGIETDPANADRAPLKIAVIEAPTKRLEGGVGYSTDVEYRANASYRDVDIDGKGLQFQIEGRFESKVQNGSVRFTQPPNDRNWIGTYSAAAERTDIEGLVTHTASAGTRWYWIEERDERAVSATFYYDKQEPSGAASQSSHAFYPEYERYWRRVDNLVAPSSGWMASVQAGGGIPGISTRGFGRVVGRYTAWLPLNRTNEVQFRGEAGAVLAPTRDGIPSTLLFRTGGDTTVRGYAFNSLGVQNGDAIVPGRYYVVASAEAIHWIREAWGVAAFVDAGNAMDSLNGIHLALGYGAGLRVRTPLGPFRLDVAYGQDVHKVRMHFSIGISF